ncbi:MAG: hypothetical protein U0414_02610 [Polyangiaceae bacterium]
MTRHFLRYEWLDALPERLFRPAVKNAHGRLTDRGHAMDVLREALLAGRVPGREELQWPSADLRPALTDALRASGIASACKGDPELTDDILLFLLDAVDEADGFFDRAFVAFQTLAADGEHEEQREQ